jgi:hypothetical protein
MPTLPGSAAGSMASQMQITPRFTDSRRSIGLLTEGESRAFYYLGRLTDSTVIVQGPAHRGAGRREGDAGIGRRDVRRPRAQEFTIESDQALKIARSNGITATRVSMAVSMSPVKGTTRPVWVVMDEGGTKAGHRILDIDATSGVVVGTTKQ